MLSTLVFSVMLAPTHLLQSPATICLTEPRLDILKRLHGLDMKVGAHARHQSLGVPGLVPVKRVSAHPKLSPVAVSELLHRPPSKREFATLEIR